MLIKTQTEIIFILSLLGVVLTGGCATTKPAEPAKAMDEKLLEHYLPSPSSQQESSQANLPPKQEENTDWTTASDMMGKMDMKQMSNMMNNCRYNKKDNKMCENQTIEKCRENMNKQDCLNLMSETKKQNNTENLTK
jgi:hypothetical protein